MENLIYLDNAATTKPFEGLGKIFEDCMVNFYNPSSVYMKSVEMHKRIDQARYNICKAIGGQHGTLIFTSGATEANNIALSGVKVRNGSNIVVSAIEHPSVYNKAKQLNNIGTDVRYLKVDKFGRVVNINDTVDQNTKLVSIMHVNNETGSINDIKNLVSQIKKFNSQILVHVDGTQAVGKIKVDLLNLGVDMYTFSSHKVHGVKGTGALWVKKGVNIQPLILGGGQENNLRSGTENVFGILAFEYAINKVVSDFENNFRYVEKIKTAILEGLTSKNVQFLVNGGDFCSPYILNLSFKDSKSEVLLHMLETQNILVSNGSACSSKKPENRTLKEMGKSASDINTSVRLSFSAYDEYDVDNIVEVIYTCVKNLQNKITGKK